MRGNVRMSDQAAIDKMRGNISNCIEATKSSRVDQTRSSNQRNSTTGRHRPTHREHQVAFARLLVLANQAIHDRVRLRDALVIVHLHRVLLMHGKVDEATVRAAEAEAARRVARLCVVRWVDAEERKARGRGKRGTKNKEITRRNQKQN